MILIFVISTTYTSNNERDYSSLNANIFMSPIFSENVLYTCHRLYQ